MQNYRLYPTCNNTAPKLVWQAALKIPDVELELFKYIDMHLVVEE